MSFCSKRKFGQVLELYLLGQLSEEDESKFEQHLMECDQCFQEVRRYNKISLYLLHDKDLRDEANRLARNDREASELEGAGQESDTGASRRYLFRRLVAVAAVLAILILQPWRITISPTDTANAAEDRIAIMPLTLTDQLEQGDWLGAATTTLLYAYLTEVLPRRVVSREQISDAITGLTRSRTDYTDLQFAYVVGDRVLARWICLGEVKQVYPNIELGVVVVDTESMDTVSIVTLIGEESDNVLSASRKLAARLDSSIGLADGDYQSIRDRSHIAYTDSPEALRLYLAGVVSKEEYDYDSAIMNFRKCLKLDSAMAMAWYYLSCYDDPRHISKALEFIDNATPRDRYYIRSRNKMLKGDQEGRRDELKALLSRYPFERSAYIALAFYEFGARNYEASEEYLLKAIEIDPRYGSAYNLLAYWRSFHRDLEGAIRYLDLYASVAPDEANPYDSRGDVFGYNGLIDSAIAAYRTALSIDPEFRTSRFNLGRRLIRKGEFAAAEEVFGGSFTTEFLRAETWMAFDLINIPIHQGRFQEARHQLLESIENANTARQRYRIRELLTAAHLRHALMLSEISPDSAIGELRSAISELSTYSEPHNIGRLNIFLALLLSESQQLAQADSIATHYGDGIAEKTGNDSTTFRFISGCVDLARKDYASALENLAASAQALSTTNSYAYRLKYGQVLLETGAVDSAIAVLERLTSTIDYGYEEFLVWQPRARLLLGTAYETAEQFEKARQQYTTILSDWKDADDNLLTLRSVRKRISALQRRK